MTKPVDFVIFDFETLDTRSWKCKVLSFGCIAGYWEDIESGNIEALLKNGTEVFFDLKTQNNYDRVHSQATIDWWKKQPIEAQNSFKNKEKVDLNTFPELFTNICYENNINKNTIIICRGTDFDAVIIHSIYDYFEKPIPYNHFNLRDIRSMLDVAVGSSYLKNFNDYCNKKYGLQKHTALHDCARDIIQLYYGISKTPEEIDILYKTVGMKYIDRLNILYIKEDIICQP